MRQPTDLPTSPAAVSEVAGSGQREWSPVHQRLRPALKLALIVLAVALLLVALQIVVAQASQPGGTSGPVNESGAGHADARGVVVGARATAVRNTGTSVAAPRVPPAPVSGRTTSRASAAWASGEGVR